MTRPPSERRRVLRAAIAACGLAATVGSGVVGAGEPGPVPLLRDAAADVVAPAEATPRASAGLGDWRLVAALGVTFAVLVGVRMAAVRRVPPPPPDVFEVLGTAALGGQHTVRIVRFGPKTLLVGVSSAGATTLAEIGDPQATACIAAACRGGDRPREQPRPSGPPRGTGAKEAA